MDTHVTDTNTHRPQGCQTVKQCVTLFSMCAGCSKQDRMFELRQSSLASLTFDGIELLGWQALVSSSGLAT